MQTRLTTKELIAASFMELAAQKPIDKITVREVAANCAITTVTFYNHFRDKYDLIVWSYAQNTLKIMRKIGADGYRWQNALWDWARYFSEERGFLLNALRHTSGHDSFLTHMQKINIDLLTAEVKKRLGTKPLTPALEGAIRLYCYGLSCLCFDWLTAETPLPPDDFAKILFDSLPPPIAGYLG
ncbi:MAG: TetR family transcriptional regulator [Treponema sp.]|nr:TetR family transcriptional regulator [Treponema sp.]